MATTCWCCRLPAGHAFLLTAHRGPEAGGRFGRCPRLIDYLPSQDLVPNSERYVEGPAALQKFYPGISPSTAAFHLSAEAQIGEFQAPGGDLKLAIFSYPTPQIARLQTAQFQQISGAMVKRSGPLVAVILSPPNPDAAEKLLSLIRYQADITLDERVSRAATTSAIW